MKPGAAIAPLLAGSCAAQCPPVWTPGGLQAVFNQGDNIRAICRDDADIVIAGKFSVTDHAGVSGHHTARWDGTRWNAMPGIEPRMDGYPAAVAARAFLGSPMVGGQFRLTGAPLWSAVARWDGTAWRNTDPPIQGEVHSMVEYQGRLIVAGFIFLPGVLVSAAAYNGVSWEPMWSVPQTATHVAVNGNDLFLGASASYYGPGYVYRWNGYLWDAIAILPGNVTAMTSHQGSLVAGVDATGPGGAFGVMRYDGAAWDWISPSPSRPPGGFVNALASDGHALFAAGWAPAGTSYVPLVNALRDGAWQDISRLAGGVVWGLHVDAESRWAVGTFGTAAGQPSLGVARWSEPAACYPNCDCSQTLPVLNVADFVCFSQRFAAADPYANCDGSTAPPTLNVLDFVCFQQQFAAGCP